MPNIVQIVVAGSVLAFSSSLSAETVTATGTIEAVDATTRTITILWKTATDEKTAQFKVAGATILYDGEASGLDRFEVGQKVDVT